MLDRHVQQVERIGVFPARLARRKGCLSPAPTAPSSVGEEHAPPRPHRSSPRGLVRTECAGHRDERAAFDERMTVVTNPTLTMRRSLRLVGPSVRRSVGPSLRSPNSLSPPLRDVPTSAIRCSICAAWSGTWCPPRDDVLFHHETAIVVGPEARATCPTLCPIMTQLDCRFGTLSSTIRPSARVRR